MNNNNVNNDNPQNETIRKYHYVNERHVAYDALH